MRYFMTANRARQVHMELGDFRYDAMGPQLLDDLGFRLLRSADDDYPGLSHKILAAYLKHFIKDMDELGRFGGNAGGELYELMSNLSKHEWSDEATAQIQAFQKWCEIRWPNYRWGSLFSWGLLNPDPEGTPNTMDDPILIQAEDCSNRHWFRSTENGVYHNTSKYDGWIHLNSIHIPAAGRYTVEVRIATKEETTGEGEVELSTYVKNPELTDFTSLSSASINNTGGNWITTTMEAIFPEAGYQTLRLASKAAPISVDWVQLQYVGP